MQGPIEACASVLTPMPRLSRAILGVFIFIVLAFLVGALLPGLDSGPGFLRSRQQIRCASNLRQIGLAIKMYANMSDECYPQDLSVVLLTQDLPADVLVCPAVKTDRPAAGPTTRTIATEVAEPALHHCSYIYAGKGLRDDTIGADDVLAFELPSNHENEGFNVLFADGHVDWQSCVDGTADASIAKHLLSDYVDGIHPLRLRP